MKIITIIVQIGILYLFYLAGEWVQELLSLTLPGSILGLLLLWAALLCKLLPAKWIDSGANFIQSYLPLIFIPATIGIMNYFNIFAGKGMLLILVVIASTLITMVAAGYTSQFIVRLAGKGKEL
ncbi:CidA/LrgA family holin-like protein [Paenibacillus oenotherae]|uniref:CidA/LrgA family holin-like protein n=1 Tax=Paenibacillus oenotherae TaxID=1435645 RepID=A0ABS7D7P0_9BACL|nr:CidA/LrgA family holin-like protein [Paenibacillus oenotherae]MBW7475839.1 CidA/LrgA family holin-like protein [Paenibacillus oenotherae]